MTNTRSFNLTVRTIMSTAATTPIMLQSDRYGNAHGGLAEFGMSDGAEPIGDPKFPACRTGERVVE